MDDSEVWIATKRLAKAFANFVTKKRWPLRTVIRAECFEVIWQPSDFRSYFELGYYVCPDIQIFNVAAKQSSFLRHKVGEGLLINIAAEQAIALGCSDKGELFSHEGGSVIHADRPRKQPLNAIQGL